MCRSGAAFVMQNSKESPNVLQLWVTQCQLGTPLAVGFLPSLLLWFRVPPRVLHTAASMSTLTRPSVASSSSICPQLKSCALDGSVSSWTIFPLSFSDFEQCRIDDKCSAARTFFFVVLLSRSLLSVPWSHGAEFALVIPTCKLLLSSSSLTNLTSLMMFKQLWLCVFCWNPAVSEWLNRQCVT